jgi:hypothetical protein
MNSLPQSSGGNLSSFSEACICGRTFIQPSALHYHQRSCTKTKKRLAGALSKAKETWRRKKRRILEPEPETPSQEVVDHDNESQNVVMNSSEVFYWFCTLSMRQTTELT